MSVEEFVGIDVETTGFDPSINEIVEVYARRFDSMGKLKEVFHQYCRPEAGYIPIEASNVNGITFEKVAGEPSYFKGEVQKKLAEFIGKRTVVGHNVIAFDLKFLKLNPVKVEDTLLMCRQKYRKGNKLSSACKRIGIKFDTKQAHAAGYDVEKTIELFLKMKQFTKVEKQPELDFRTAKEMLETQIYSYSRINLFIQCPFKWYKRYIEKIPEPSQSYLVTGSICHKIAEWSALWCYRESFSSKFVAYANKKGLNLSAIEKEATKRFQGSDQPKIKLCAYYLYENQHKIKEFLGEDGLIGIIEAMNSIVSENEYEKASMPDMETYDNIMKKALDAYHCNDIDIIRDVGQIMMRFYQYHDFSLNFGQVALVEQRIAFTRDWKRSNDWFNPKNFFRGIIDLLEYVGDRTVVITDYKTSRVMKSVDQLKQDMQFKMYALLVWYYMPANSIDKIIVRVNYLRHNRCVEYEIADIEYVANEAKEWINTHVQQIESAIVKDDKDSFPPVRNAYCSTCFLAERGTCPLFSKKHINNIDDIENFIVADIEDCQTAWKRIEADKMEILNLVGKCKTFVKRCDTRIPIDEKASLSFWAQESRDYRSKETAALLIKKGLKMSDFINYFNITQANINKILDRFDGIELNDEELNSISKIKTRQEFNAYTEEEATGKGFINR